ATLIMTTVGVGCHEDQVPSREVRGSMPLIEQGAAVDGSEVASVYCFEPLPRAVQAWDAVHEVVAGGAGALPPDDFALELGEGSVLGRPPGPRWLRDPHAGRLPAAARSLEAASTPPRGTAAALLLPSAPAEDALAAALRPPCGDPRILAVARDSRGRRDRSVGDALSKQTEYERDDWSVLGPPARLGFLLFRRGWGYVQLGIPELASFEFLARQLQLIEGRDCVEKTQEAAVTLQGRGKKDATAQGALSAEVGFSLGIGKTKGNACISPARTQFIAEQVWNEAAASDERRKACEERALRTPWPRAFASGMLCRCRPSTWTTVSTPFLVGGPASGRLAERPGAGGATRASTHSTGSTIVLARAISQARAWFADQAQLAAVEELPEHYRRFELPPGCSEQHQFCKASLAEVLSTTPSYQNTSRVRHYDKARVAWPALSGPPVEVGPVARQADAVQLQGWRQSMLRSAGEVEELQRRLVFDARVASTYFKSPPNTVLPTPSAWACLESTDDFYVAQGGIQCAFYHMAVPPDLGNFFRLPTISNRFAGLKSVGSVNVGRRALLQPVVRVMPMGSNWALYFCQSALVRGMLDAVIQPNRHLADGAAPAPLVSKSDLVAAGYVDNFCAASQSAALATADARELAQALTSRGLPARDFTEAQTERVFTGIQFSGKTGMSRVRPDRLARLRQAILALLSRGSASRGALASMVRHATWAMIMRRECLSIFNGVYGSFKLR
ncbi:unnamed protein product, partial [Prorocentrum cordatum]